MNELLLNERLVRTDRPASVTLLDFVRYDKHLKGTKIGCREGDCGACTVLLGELIGGRVKYQSVTSCISPLGNAFGKHVVTIDGLKMKQLSKVQQALVDEGASQCGFCTPGFAVSLTGFCISCNEPDYSKAIASIDGNICRCTGYKAIERSVEKIVGQMTGSTDIASLVKEGFLPEYFRGIPDKLSAIKPKRFYGETVVGGGTDLYVQRPEAMAEETVNLVARASVANPVKQVGKTCRISGTATPTDLWESEVMNQHFPDLKSHLKLVSSTPIRNMGTIAGNLVNASPIGDLTIFFLGLNASIVLKGKKKRTIPLRELYLDYKKLAKDPEEIVESIEFRIPDPATQFNFEKVCKRTHLDIASVNTAMQIETSDDCIGEVHLSAGGVGPIPKYLAKTSKWMTGKNLSAVNLKKAAEMLSQETSPISDARGTAEYKNLLLRQLFFAHFLELFPNRFTLSELV